MANLAYLTMIPLWLDSKQDAHDIVNLNSSLRHIMSMCTHMLKEKKGMMSTLAGTKLGVSGLEDIFSPKFHAEIACREAGSCINVCCHLCQRGIPSKRNLSLKEKWRGKGEALDNFYQRRNEKIFELISTCWLTMSCHRLWPIQSITTAAVLSTCLFQWQSKTL